jgi:glucose-6-phosphate isomerase
MFQGEKINTTEQRAVLHTALRNSTDKPVYVDGEDVMPGIRAVLEKMAGFSRSVHNGEWLGFSGKPIKDIVNIGIGGSDLGPGLIIGALKPFKQNGLNVHFVSNVEGSDIAETLEGLDAETTLFLVASKGFNTSETLTNAHTAREWIIYAAGEESAVANHFVAISANKDAVRAFGIDPANMFELWDWVGGRYSVWSSISLAAVLYFGMDTFKEILAGAYEMDQHFLDAPAEKNIPVILAMLGIWYNNFFDAPTYAILPYEEHLKRLPAYLQQLDMESNGKRTDRDGVVADYAVGPVIWGQLGGKGQHAFFQLLHQGARLVPADFLVPVESYHPLGRHHQIMMANCFAQTEALMRGRTKKEAEAVMLADGAGEETINRLLPFKTFPGNNPSNTFVYQKLTPRTLGTILAMYEHKIFTQGVVWNINSFDQM